MQALQSFSDQNVLPKGLTAYFFFSFFFMQQYVMPISLNFGGTMIKKTW